jgi:hypothetical protein
MQPESLPISSQQGRMWQRCYAMGHMAPFMTMMRDYGKCNTRGHVLSLPSEGHNKPVDPADTQLALDMNDAIGPRTGSA